MSVYAYINFMEIVVRQLFDKLKEGSSIEMELQETFFSKFYGSLRDKFGIIWQVMYDDGEM